MEEQTIHGVRNLRALVIRALQDELRERKSFLPPDEFEECLADLTLKAVELGARYDPRKGSLAFDQLAYSLTRRRYIDWLRKRERTQRAIPHADLPERSYIPDEEVIALARSLDSHALTPESRSFLTRIALTKVEGGLPMGAGFEKDVYRLQQELIETGIVSVNGSIHFT